MTRSRVSGASRAFAALLALSCASFASASPVTVLSADLLPARRFPGDLVEARLAFDPGLSRPVEAGIVFPEPPPGFREATELVEAVLTRADGRWTCVVRFRVWESGALELPAFTVGDCSFPSLAVSVESALSAFGRSDPLPAAQLEVTGTRALVLGAAGTLLLLVSLALVVAFRILPWLRALMAEWRSGRTRRELLSAIAWLERRGDELEAAAAWALLSSRVRAWLTHAAFPAVAALTARELASARPEPFAAEAWDPLARLLARSEAVRFAGRAAGRAELAAACAAARAALETWEETRHAGLR
ncbi:MAG: hypothetical protein JXA15_02965 [Spirochaetales bacterium]|nr:hypothetical protein [Spirochaetales bacterium]